MNSKTTPKNNVKYVDLLMASWHAFEIVSLVLFASVVLLQQAHRHKTMMRVVVAANAACVSDECREGRDARDFPRRNSRKKNSHTLSLTVYII